MPADQPSEPDRDALLTGRRVLVVEDDPTVREVTCDYLREAGFVVDEASDGIAALRRVEATPPDLIVLDRMLPGVSGTEVCRRVRRSSTIPVVMLTALGSVEERIEGLEAGADDYVAKPFSPRELLLRVRSVLRRSLDELAPESAFEIGDFAIDPGLRRIRHRGVELNLPVREFDLLAFLLKHPDRVFRRDELLREVWHWNFGDQSTVTVHVRRVRERIEADPSEPRYLVTAWGVGYRFDPTGAAVEEVPRP